MKGGFEMFKNLFVVFSVIFLLSACATGLLSPMPSVCEKPEAAGSQVCAIANETGMAVEDIDLILQVAALKGVDQFGKEVAIDFFDKVEKFLITTSSYTELINFIKEQVELTGPEVLVISRFLMRLQSPNVISDFDRGLILEHIKRQKLLL